MSKAATHMYHRNGARSPRIGFLGVGWIGRHRMNAIIQTGMVNAVAIFDASLEKAEEARELAPSAEILPSLDAFLEQDLDGVVIATPSALHADQSIRMLNSGIAVFCQKPLGRSEQEVAAVVAAARENDRLLGVDFSYRHIRGMRRIREIIRAGELGTVFAADLVFHNAYGPDKAWFYDRELSGGGCVMDLGVHLADLALWVLDFPKVSMVHSRLFRQGLPLRADHDGCEDFAVATIELASGAVVRLACSWRLQAGCDAAISARFYGTEAGAGLRNVNGSFYDFVAEHFRGTQTETMSEPPDEWGGRAAADWAHRLASGERFALSCHELTDVAALIDAIYGR